MVVMVVVCSSMLVDSGNWLARRPSMLML